MSLRSMSLANSDFFTAIKTVGRLATLPALYRAQNHPFSLIFLSLFFFGKKARKPPKKQGFFIPTEPLKSLQKKGKNARKKTRNFSQGRKTRNSKKTRKGRTGLTPLQYRPKGVLGKGVGNNKNASEMQAQSVPRVSPGRECP